MHKNEFNQIAFSESKWRGEELCKLIIMLLWLPFIAGYFILTSGNI